MFPDRPKQRFGAEQVKQIKQARELRAKAARLLAQTSRGEYIDSELDQFYEIVKDVNIVLYAPWSDFAEKGGISPSFFPSIVRNPRRIKLQNFQRALSAIIAVADDRLQEADAILRDSFSAQASTDPSTSTDNLDSLLALAVSLRDLAKAEIERLDAELPNDADRIKSNAEQRELLVVFYAGFDRIARALSALIAEPNDTKLRAKTARAVAAVSDAFEQWWAEHGGDAVDWTIRMPVMAAGVALLDLAGADMRIGTAAVAATVGGQKVLSAVASRIKKRGQ